MLPAASHAAAAPTRMPAVHRAGRIAENHTEDIAALRTEGEADADFLGAAGYGEREQAVNADGGEQECNGGEGA